MLVWGYVVSGLGVLFVILFILADVGGAHIKALPFIIAIGLIFAGIKLIQSGKGILQAEATSIHHAEISKQLTMSQDVAAAVMQLSAHNWKIIRYLAIAYIVIFLSIGIVIGIFDKNSPNALGLAFVFGVLGLLTALMTVGAFWLLSRLPMKRDIRGKYYLRTQGPIKVSPFLGGAILQLADRAFMINGKNGMKELSKLNAGTVDYTPHAHIILAAWDRDGRIVYCVSGYHVEL